MNALICLATLFLASSAGQAGDPPESYPWLIYSEPVSYTHLTLPTNVNV